VDVQKETICKSVKVKQLLTYLFFALGTFSTIAQRQGVKGQLFWVNGNVTTETEKKHIPQHGMVREIFVYELATPSDVELEDDYFVKVHTNLASRGFCKVDGSFKLKLEPGQYSVFVKEDKGLYANVFDSENHISSVTVLPRKYSWITISINYKPRD
jgi:hypothetical protein